MYAAYFQPIEENSQNHINYTIFHCTKIISPFSTICRLILACFIQLSSAANASNVIFTQLFFYAAIYAKHKQYWWTSLRFVVNSVFFLWKFLRNFSSLSWFFLWDVKKSILMKIPQKINNEHQIMCDKCKLWRVQLSATDTSRWNCAYSTYQNKSWKSEVFLGIFSQFHLGHKCEFKQCKSC